MKMLKNPMNVLKNISPIHASLLLFGAYAAFRVYNKQPILPFEIKNMFAKTSSLPMAQGVAVGEPTFSQGDLLSRESKMS